ncbi:MAG: cobalamin B12-binding domain-containing protein [Bacteriovorax sp.]|nr:cobalamin B12-binding domain-containing protein [Bacteriovorax sp.]
MAVITGPKKSDFDPTLNRLLKLPRPHEAKQLSSLHFGLIVPPSPFVMPYGWEWANTAPFEGPSMIAGLLKGLGYKVTLLDQREIYEPEDLATKISDFDMIGISTWGDGFNYLRKACEVIKAVKPNVPIVLGGPLITSLPLVIMKHLKADYAICGEGELTLTEFMDWYTKNQFAKPIEKINGLVFRDPAGNLVKNTARAQIEDQDALPYQDFSVWDRFKKDSIIPEIFMSYSRGCIANCTFCYRAFPNLNVKSVERVRQEIEYYAQQYKFRFVWWSDLTYITDKDYTNRLTDEAWSAHDFRSVVFSRVTGIDVPVLKRMRDRGLDLVLYGMESVSKATLSNYHKGTSKNAIIDCININREAQVKIGGLFIVGAPTDTREVLQETIDFCAEFKEITRVKYLSAITGTQDYFRFLKEGVIKDELTHLDWLSRERSVEEDILQPGFIKFTPHMTHEELREVYQKINGNIEKRPYDYRNPLNHYLPTPDAKFFKRPVYLGNTLIGSNIQVYSGDVRMDELMQIEKHSIEETKRIHERAEKQNQEAKAHFKNRSSLYNKSSNWVNDQTLISNIFNHAKIKGDEVVLDIATGTGLVAKAFKGKVKEIIGLDISPDMTEQAKPNVDRLIISSVEANIPLEKESVDVVICRQGLQFVNLDLALAEIGKVLKTNGRVVFTHLASYNVNDRADTFKIQALRNPARVNFFAPGDLESALELQGFEVKEVVQYRSRESVTQWINHGASTEEERTAIYEAYKNAGPEFMKTHEVEFTKDDIFDSMLFLIVVAEKKVVTEKEIADPILMGFVG